MRNLPYSEGFCAMRVRAMEMRKRAIASNFADFDALSRERRKNAGAKAGVRDVRESAFQREAVCVSAA
ncbi:hypothetical protein A9R05_00455 [Burkholderia sp. KK1]|nr:hypothetical protein A9R05_00455 [Burkholderia sp. KK1]